MNRYPIAALLAALPILYSDARGAEVKGGGIMPAERQNAVVRQYCGSCHSDALMYGGLSLEHFDAAKADASLAAMLVSKLTNGRTPSDVNAAAQGPDADSNVMKLLHGAMGAAGTGVPGEATQVAFGEALSIEADGAYQWHAQRNERELTADLLRDVPSTVFAGKTDMYRLILTCPADAHQGEIRLAWANGVPDEGREMTVQVDGDAPFTHKVDGGRKQGNGDNGPGATVLWPDARGSMTLPARSLTVRNVFPDETLVFSFEGLDPAVRHDLGACFARPR